jgi:Cu(I)/Ag(I) efflux system membrane protein CusA/SilA
MFVIPAAYRLMRAKKQKDQALPETTPITQTTQEKNYD